MNRKGGLTLPVFHCLFNGTESITHYLRQIDLALYTSLPNLYAVCISDNAGANRKIIAGLFKKNPTRIMMANFYLRYMRIGICFWFESAK